MKTPVILAGMASRHENFVKPNVNLSVHLDLTAASDVQVAANKLITAAPHVVLTGMTREAFDRFTSGEVATITIQ